VPRYIVERTYSDGFAIPGAPPNLSDHIDRNADHGVSWLHSYVSCDRTKSFCIYDGPSPEAIRKTAARNRLPIDRITEVCVLDPYSYSPR
jgi:hypothetical protein